MGRRVLLTAFLDTNILIRYLVADPPDQAERATRLLETAEGLLLVDLVVAECVYVLQSVYRVEPSAIAELMGRVSRSTPSGSSTRRFSPAPSRSMPTSGSDSPTPT